MEGVLNHHSFASLMGGLKKQTKQADLADKLGLSAQKVNQIFKNKQHLVYPQVSRWRKVLKLKRVEGDYFELLALIHAFRYNTEAQRQIMLKRAFHLAGRLEEQLNPSGEVSRSLIYWLDPLIPILRNMVELADFPINEEEIPYYMSERVTYVGVLGNLQKNIINRTRTTWKFLIDSGSIVYSQTKKRYVKSQANVFSMTEIGPDSDDLQSVILLLNQLITYHDFSRSAGTPHMLGDKLATFSVPSRILDLIDQLSRDFLFGDILTKLTYASNKNDLVRLEQKDPEYYKEVLAFKKDLELRGYEVPECTDEDIDTTVQVLLAARRITKDISEVMEKKTPSATVDEEGDEEGDEEKMD